MSSKPVLFPDIEHNENYQPLALRNPCILGKQRAGSRGLLECKPGIMPLVALAFHLLSIASVETCWGPWTWSSYQRYVLSGPNSSNRQYIRLVLMTMLYDDAPTTSFTLFIPTIFFSSTHAVLHCHAQSHIIYPRYTQYSSTLFVHNADPTTMNIPVNPLRPSPTYLLISKRT